MLRLASLAVLSLATGSVALAAGPSTLPPSGFDTSSVDKSVDACSDFYQHVCGGWMKQNPIPADQSRWGRFDVLREDNLAVLRGILEGAAKAKKRDADTQKIGDYYASCMDEKAIDKKGLDPLKPTLAKIAGLTDKKQIPALLATLHDEGSGAMFNFGPEPDFKNATMYIAAVDQGGLGLPERDYYFRDDPKSVEQRKQYVAHVSKMFQLAGEKADAADAKAKVVMDLETKLAKGSLDIVSMRDPTKIYHKMPLSELAAATPAFDWSMYFDAVPTKPRFTDLNVAWPDFFKAMDEVVAGTSLDDLKTYLTWHELHLAAPYLSKPFVDENFAFYGKALTGAKELKPRWKRCVEFVDSGIGEALGRTYVERTFGPEAKQRVLAMVNAIEKALGDDIKALDWMSQDTKTQAFAKLDAVKNKIGYPDKWRDYSALTIQRGDALGNALRANAFEVHRQLKKIETPVDPSEWGMTPPTVNAYYNPLENNINFPAGILQPPFFGRKADDAINFGGIGAVIGHELTHGFDDEGRQFDAKGNLRDWWTAEDNKRFDERAQCFVDEYAGFTAVEDVKLNGKLTLGENTADNGGLRIALMALAATLGDKKVAPIDGYTPDQRLFLGWAQVWCQNVTPEASRMRAQTDPHSPGRYRVNGVVSNMPEFRKAFSCKADAPMVRPNMCRVW